MIDTIIVLGTEMRVFSLKLYMFQISHHFIKTKLLISKYLVCSIAHYSIHVLPESVSAKWELFDSEATLLYNFNICDIIQVCECMSDSFTQNEKFGEVSSDMCILHHKDLKWCTGALSYNL